ncbi:MAG: penicillin-insensitive murein endopeptidase [Myxococcales bacterium]|nr:penicillin-insensitive murein endopeptidase [Myxococcales bacterium]MCB9716357.1 penicillin-insensitive murein endopeptidase [Myxococcales bacterium]
MYDSEHRWPRIRRRRPWWSILLLAGLGWPTVAAARAPSEPEPEVVADDDEVETGEAELETAGDRPTRAPAHADCDHRMPLYEHAVQPGEHLGLIAGRYGVRRTELVALNPQISDPNLIVPGQLVRVCPEIFPRLTETVEITVAPGETLGEIAEAHGLSLRALLEQNPKIHDANHVRVGQRLTLRIDGGLHPDFLPPEPKKSRRGAGGGGGRRAEITVRLTPSDDIFVKRPKLAFGTPKTIRLLERAVAQYKRQHRGSPKVLVGDISQEGGGALHPHVSHRTGRDIDLGYVLRGTHGERTRFGGVSRETLDVARTWSLIKAFVDTEQVVYVFVDYRIQEQLYEHAKSRGVPQQELDELFQYPHGRGRAHGIIRHWPNHAHHFHVRFRS